MSIWNKNEWCLYGHPEAIRLIMEQAQLFGEDWAIATI